MSTEYDALKLENQLCFPLYACSREVVKKYTPVLDKLDLTYTQYIAMMVLWEHQELSVSEMGHLLHLDSGTLTPLLKKLEQKGLCSRSRAKEDERVVLVSVTEKGNALKEQAVEVPGQIASCIPLSPDEAATLYGLLYKMLGNM